MQKLLCIAAATGFVASFIVHVLTFTDISVTKVFPGVFILHIGIFVLALMSGFTLKNFNQSLSNLPQKFIVPMVCLFAYAGLNFFITLHLNEMGVPGTLDGKSVLQSHGRVIRVLTATESVHHSNYLVRGFSGHWMLFYFLFAAGLSSAKLPGNKIGN